MTRLPLLTVGCALWAGTAMAETLTIYTYDSFVSEWGPGPAVKTTFEAECGCELEFVGAGDGAALLARLRLEGDATDADIVLGLDTSQLAAAKETGLFATHGLDAAFDLPISWVDDTFVPFDWGWFAFVGNAGAEAPPSLQALAESDLKVVIQDPRSSTPGLGLLYWVKAAFGDEAGPLWEALSDNIVTVTPGWSEAYGLFLEGEADAVLSYTTSPAYHLIAEEDSSKIAWAFEEGHYMQVEVAAITASTNARALADQFLDFMVSDAFQSLIPTTNWMYPAVTPKSGLPDGFDTLITPEASLLYSPEEAAGLYQATLDEWRSALSR